MDEHDESSHDSDGPGEAADLRVVSLIASATESVCALGGRDLLVGRSHECDHPPSVRELPVCTEPKFDVEGTSYEIDERVKAILQEGLSVYRVDAELLRRLRPDVVVTQSQCEVCAVSVDDVGRALERWVASPVRVVDLRPEALTDIWRDVETVAAALDRAERGRELVESLRGRVTDIREAVRREVGGVVGEPATGSGHVETEGADARPSVAYIEWIDPLMAGGNWMPELIELAGGRNLFGTAGGHAPELSWEEVVDADPDVIVIAPCGFDIPRARRDLDLLRSREGWDELQATRSGRAVVADGLQYFNRPGPRIVESLEILAEILHPETFRFGHRGRGWEPVRSGTGARIPEQG